MTTTNDAPRLRNHWWPRPGWQPGRIMLTWHLTFNEAHALHEHVTEYQNALARLPGLNLVPTEWLHLTIQGISYADEASAEKLAEIIESVGSELATMNPFNLTFGRPVVFGEAIAIQPEPAEPLQQLLATIRTGIGTVTGDQAVPTGPEQANGFHPHVSIAYSHTQTDSAPYVAALAATERDPVTARIGAVSLIRQERQLDPHWLYRWTTEAAVPLGPAAI
ncbi:MAG: 2'-5' RNA ligase family protein [Pseudonocardia sp.]|uniref:2'-5' RNA ligase family protein n=1 Tax=Pseudonocardia sp. TaxID=60912 RepID=UPI001AC4E2F1|nr:2'-5' RNA ligase family protein [Pseudonocardia sp.]MBN9101129.1 2'-5' RNA ligase family protein [Pseudonocardia sp.]